VDLDGTMVDTLGDFAVALRLMLGDLDLASSAAQPVPLHEAAVAEMVGQGSDHLIRSALRHVLIQDPAVAGPVDSLYPAAWPSYQGRYERVNGQPSQGFCGVVQGLSQLRAQGIALVCLTNKPVAFARTLLERKGLADFFGQVWGGDSFERKKPNPMPLLRACGSLGSEPAATLMIGDSMNDAKAARAAGCPVVLVTYGYNHGEPISSVDADGFLDSLAELSVTAASARPF